MFAFCECTGNLSISGCPFVLLIWKVQQLYKQAVYWTSPYSKLLDTIKCDEMIKGFPFLLKNKSFNGYFKVEHQNKNEKCELSNNLVILERNEPLLHDELHPFRWLAFIPHLSLWWYSLNSQLWEEPHPRTNPGHTGGITHPIWPGDASGSPRQSRRLDSPAATVDKDGCRDKKKTDTFFELSDSLNFVQVGVWDQYSFKHFLLLLSVQI